MPSIQNAPIIILSGAPGAGKTTLLTELRQRGASVEPELARALIQQEVVDGGQALPWADARLFAQRLWSAEYQRWSSRLRSTITLAEATPPTFFDRSWVDAWAYCQILNVDVSVEMLKELEPLSRNSVVLVCSPWPQIYVQDPERKQSWSEALASHARCITAYRRLGFRLVDCPQMPVAERARWVQGLWPSGFSTYL